MTAPWIKFYPADWRADAGLHACSLTARGLWVEMLAIMHAAEPYGHLLINGQAPSTKTLCGLVNTHHKTLIACLKELSDAGVYSVNDDGVIFSRRMIRDQAKALADKENGRRGGNPRLNPKAEEGVNPPVKGVDKAQKPEARSQKNTLSNESVLRGRSAAPRKRVAAETTLPEQPTPPMLAYAADHGFVNGNAERLFAAWRDHHIARATPIADFDASFRTWVRNEIKFTRSTPHAASTAQPVLFGVAAQNARFNDRSNRGALAALRGLGDVVANEPEAPAAGDADAGIPERRRLGGS